MNLNLIIEKLDDNGRELGEKELFRTIGAVVSRKKPKELEALTQAYVEFVEFNREAVARELGLTPRDCALYSLYDACKRVDLMAQGKSYHVAKDMSIEDEGCGPAAEFFRTALNFQPREVYK